MDWYYMLFAIEETDAADAATVARSAENSYLALSLL